jgi:hypothetical protein
MAIIIVDLEVWNCQIRAFKPGDQNNPMPVDDVGKKLFWNTAPTERFNNRQFGTLKGDALRKAMQVVDKYGSITTSGIYGSIEIDSDDFVPYEGTKKRYKD